jgi:hypothetical protein
MSEVYYIRLKNGDQIVSKMETSNNKIIMDHPLEIQLFSGTQSGKPMVNLLEWITEPFVNTQSFEISANEVLISVPASEELIDFYENTIKRIILFRETKKTMNSDSDVNEYSEETQHILRNAKKYLH